MQTRESVLLLALLLVHTTGMTAEPVDNQTAEAQAAPARPAREIPIEEIEVIGERSTISLLHEIRDTEVRMFEMYNELNANDDFDVTCRDVVHTGTLIPEWECDVGFMRRERFNNMQDFFLIGGVPRSDEDMYWENRDKLEALNAEMLALAKETPPLARAMLDLHAKRQQLEAMEARRREKTKGFFKRLFGKDED